MQLFNPANRSKSPKHERLYAIYEVWYTAVDFAAAFLFIVGSILFFSSQTETTGTWLFLIGSICFALKPTIRLVRELHYLSLGDFDRLTENERA